jgi:hypothetical protein
VRKGSRPGTPSGRAAIWHTKPLRKGNGDVFRARRRHGTAPGYQGARVLANLGRPGEYLLIVDFSSREEAERNNTRAETAAWADKLRTLIDGEPTYADWRTVADTNA